MTKRAAVEAEPVEVDDVDAAWEALEAPVREQAQAARAVQEAERRQRQDRAATVARALEARLEPVAAALLAWRSASASSSGPARQRVLSPILLEQLDRAIRPAGTLEVLLMESTSTLRRIQAELAGARLLEPAQLQAHIKMLDGLRGRFAGIPSTLADWRHVREVAVTECDAAQRLVTEMIAWFTPPTEASQ
jgi:hypothetical protein